MKICSVEGEQSEEHTRVYAHFSPFHTILRGCTFSFSNRENNHDLYGAEAAPADPSLYVQRLVTQAERGDEAPPACTFEDAATSEAREQPFITRKNNYIHMLSRAVLIS